MVIESRSVYTRGRIPKEPEKASRGHRYIFYFVTMASQVYMCIKTYQISHLKYVKLTAYQLCLYITVKQKRPFEMLLKYSRKVVQRWWE